MQLIITLALLAQIVAPRGYITADQDGSLELTTYSGTYSIELGFGCDNITSNMNVEVLPGSSGVGAIEALDSADVCNISIGDQLDPTPCTTTDGLCDINASS
jgi:hypothetical protein